jgi:hypothetical protein
MVIRPGGPVKLKIFMIDARPPCERSFPLFPVSTSGECMTILARRGPSSTCGA